MARVNVPGLLVFGGAVAGYGLYRRRKRQAAMERIETVEATVVTARVNEVGSGSTDDVMGGGSKYRANVEFRYEYGGRTYESNRRHYGMGQPKTTERAARRTANEYSRGETVTVYVDPENPGQAFLERGESAQNVWDVALIGIGGACIAGGLVFGLVL